jgi:hypothetical protein
VVRSVPCRAWMSPSAHPPAGVVRRPTPASSPPRVLRHAGASSSPPRRAAGAGAVPARAPGPDRRHVHHAGLRAVPRLPRTVGTGAGTPGQHGHLTAERPAPRGVLAGHPGPGHRGRGPARGGAGGARVGPLLDRPGARPPAAAARAGRRRRRGVPAPRLDGGDGDLSRRRARRLSRPGRRVPTAGRGRGGRRAAGPDPAGPRRVRARGAAGPGAVSSTSASAPPRTTGTTVPRSAP